MTNPHPRRPLGQATTALATGLATIALTFGAAGVWAATAALSGAVVAPGRVAVATNRQVIQHPHGGVVQRIFVRAGSRVAKGDELIRLDATAVTAEVDVLARRRADLKLQEARLAAERDGRKAFIVPDNLSAPTDVLAALEADQRAIFEARRRAYEGEASAVRQSIAQVEARTGGLETRRTSVERQKALIDDELTGVRSLYERGLVTKTRAYELERAADGLAGQSGDFVAQISEARERMAELQIKIDQLARDRIEKAAAELQTVRAELGRVEPQLAEARDRTEKTVLRAPRSGEVVDLVAHTVGGVLKPGEQVLAIVPNDSALVIEADVAPADIENVAEGMAANVRLTSLRMPDVPVLAAAITRVSADRAQTDRAQTGRSYPVTVELAGPPADIERLLRVGMPVDLIVPTRQRTVLQYLLSPLSNGFSRMFRED